MTRGEIIDATKLDAGGQITTILEELEQCDFIRSFHALGKKKKETCYQLIDNFTLFYFQHIANYVAKTSAYWSQKINQPQFNTWSGFAYERVCMQHIEQIKQAMGIAGISSSVYSWQYIPKNTDEKGVQIDLLIDRDDRMINLCEIKYNQGEYEISEAYDKVLREKLSIFQNITKTKKGVSLLMITSYGLKRNQWSNNIHIQLTMDDLFAF